MSFFENMKPKTKKYFGWGVLVVAVFLLAYPLYQQKQKNKRERPEAGESVVDTDVNTFEHSILSQVEGELKAVTESQRKFQKEMRAALKAQSDLARIELEKQKAALVKEQKKIVAAHTKKQKKEIIQEIKAKDRVERERESIFERNAREKAEKQSSLNKARKKQIDVTPIPTVGFANAGYDEGSKKKTKTRREKKSKTAGRGEEAEVENTVYLPPSHMKADLLSGVVAPTSSKVRGKSSSPMILRINDLAVLPNEYKQDTKGCFVIAEGQADLSQERVEGRLVTLSCISKDGHSIIDEEVQGWIVDKDGRAGMRGRVVAKFGAHMARVTFAGVLEGFGEAFQESAYTTYDSDSVYGSRITLTDTDASTLARAGIGGGVSKAAEELSDFYINLANQTLPVIEVGPTKEVTLVISKGVELNIAKRK